MKSHKLITCSLFYNFKFTAKRACGEIKSLDKFVIGVLLDCES